VSERYLERYRLPERQYASGAPVLIAAGVLLEDTQKNRLLGQLKFESITPKTITGLQVKLHCLDGQGNWLGAAEKTYDAMAVNQGETFGQRTAVVLPAGTAKMEALVVGVTFADGTVWTAREGLMWRSLESSVSSVQRVPAAEPAPVQQSAPPAKPEGKAAFVQVAQAKKANKKWVLPVILAGVVLVAAVVFLVPTLTGGGGGSGGVPSLPTFGGGGTVVMPSGEDTVKLVMQEDSDGYCYVTEDMIRQLFPEMSYFQFAGVPNMGEDIDEYIKDSFYMARLIASEGDSGGGDSYSVFNAGNDASSPRSLLIFSDRTTLCGYAVAAPKSEGGGEWSLTVTRCSYDFSDLFARQMEAFYNHGGYDYIAPDDVEKSGATQFLYAYNMSNASVQSNITQLYHLWNQEQSPYLERHLRTMERWENFVPSGTQEQQRWRFYLLFDENNEVLGYTVRCNNGSLSFDSERMCPDIRVDAPGAGETVTVRLQEEGENFYSFHIEQLQQTIPGVTSLDLFNCAVMGHDLNDYLPFSRKMAYWVASGDPSNHRNHGAGFNAQSSSLQCLLLFSDETTLCGYAFFWGGMASGGELEVEITLCNYDLSSTYEQLSREFSGVNMFTRLQRIEPDEMEEYGVSQVVWIDSVSLTHSFGDQLQGYYLWSRTRVNANLSENSAPLEWAQENWFTDINADMVGCFLLLDENYEVLGYTRINK